MIKPINWVKKQLKKLFAFLFNRKKANVYITQIIDAASHKGYVENYSNKADSIHLDIKRKLYEEDLQKHFISMLKSLAPYFKKGKVRLARKLTSITYGILSLTRN